MIICRDGLENIKCQETREPHYDTNGFTEEVQSKLNQPDINKADEIDVIYELKDCKDRNVSTGMITTRV